MRTSVDLLDADEGSWLLPPVDDLKVGEDVD